MARFSTFFFIFLVVIGLSYGVPRERQLRDFIIEEHSDDVTVNTGEQFYLYCTVDDEGDILINDEWKFCEWQRDKDGYRCKFTYVCTGQYCQFGVGMWHVETECEEPLSDLHFDGDNPNVLNQKCGIYVPNSGPEDDGSWTCILEECSSLGCSQQYGSGTKVSATMNVTVV